LISAASHSAGEKASNSYEILTKIVRQNLSIKAVTLVTYQENLSWRDATAAQDPSAALRFKGLQQDQQSRALIKLPRTDVCESKLYEIGRDLESGKLIGVCSKVQLEDGQLVHIPMMDFLCRPSPENLDLLARLITNLRQGPGYLLHSGNSYHYYGLRLLRSGEWQAFLGKCLLMSGFADDRYIGHQLVDGYCVFRLSSGKLKNHTPTVVAELA
jgi:hypothetical protein